MNPSLKDAISHPGRLLTDHLISVTNEINKYFSIPHKGAREVAIIMGLTHDLGKSTNEFQKYIIANEEERWKFSGHAKDHSAISSAITLALILYTLREKSFNEDDTCFLSLLGSICVRKHHGDIDFEFDGYISNYLDHELIENYTPEQLEQKLPLDEIFDWIKAIAPIFGLSFSSISKNLLLKHRNLDRLLMKTLEFKEKLYSKEYSIIFLELFSLLVGCDKIDATFEGKAPDFSLIPRIPSNIVENFRSVVFVEPLTDMNRLRAEIADNIRNNILLNLDRRLFTLTAPTGSGKTLAAFDVALKLAENRNAPIIYCLPFTSIIDQNFKEAERVFEKNNIPITEDMLLKHHHLTPSSYRMSKNFEYDNEFDLDKQEMLVEAWHSRFVITTFVQLFETLFSGKNRALKRLFIIPGAIIILDEIQAIPRKFWGLIRESAKIFSENYGTCFILMTATQPEIFSGLNAIELLPGFEKYFQSLSRIRLILHNKNEISIEFLAEKISKEFYENSERSLIAVLNTIDDSIRLFKEIKPRLPQSYRNLYYLSSNIIPMDRKERIDLLKEQKHWILVSTQVIEAGVDISADIVHRDFAPIDSIIQSAGRCNRNNLNQKGIVHLWKIKNEDKKRVSSRMIYDSVLLDAVEDILKNKNEIIEEPEFIQIVREYFRLVWQRGSNNDCLAYLQNFDFDKLTENSSLIEEAPNMNQYFVIKQNDGEANELWIKFQKIQEIMDFKERNKEFLKIKQKFFDRVISVREIRRNDTILPIYEPYDYEPIIGYLRKKDGSGCTII